MNRIFKLILAGLVTIGLLLVGTTVWADSRDGSLGGRNHGSHLDCSRSKTINMGDATFTLLTPLTKCDFSVKRTNVSHFKGRLPRGLTFRSDGFTVSTTIVGPAMLKVCFAYSPMDAKKNATIYYYNGFNWVRLGGALQGGRPQMLCVTTSLLNSTFALVGNQGNQGNHGDH